MRRVLKWIGIVLGVLLGVVVVAAVALYLMGTARLNRTYDTQAEEIAIPSDDESLARGEYIVRRICAECHRGDLGGSVPDDIFVDEPGLFTLYAANITPGEGGIGDLSDAELVRAIRHGIDQDDTPLIVMPAEIFIHMSEEDLGAVIAYLRELPPIDNVVPDPQISVLARIMAGADMIGSVFPAEYINHDMPFPEMPEIGVNSAYGEYLAAAWACALCHGENLAGGITPVNAPPGDFPLSANLTGDNLADWTEDDFEQVLRTGRTPDGHEIDQEHMPWQIYAQLSDDDIGALWLYVQSLPAADSASE